MSNPYLPPPPEPVNWEKVYVELGALAANLPSFSLPLNAEAHMWIGRLVAIAEELAAGAVETVEVKVASSSPGFSPHNLMTALYRYLARAERRVPAAMQGAFIPVGHGYDAFVALGKLLHAATASVLIVDPYMDEKALEFATLVPSGVTPQLLADEKYCQPSFAPALARWRAQHQQQRPVEARLTPKRKLHDRLIIVDSKDAWILTQSLNAFAARSPATILKVDPETAALKVAAYADLWQAATSI